MSRNTSDCSVSKNRVYLYKGATNGNGYPGPWRMRLQPVRSQKGKNVIPYEVFRNEMQKEATDLDIHSDLINHFETKWIRYVLMEIETNRRFFLPAQRNGLIFDLIGNLHFFIVLSGKDYWLKHSRETTFRNPYFNKNSISVQVIF